MPDFLIIGAGVIGLTTAWELARRGLSVKLLDRSTPGREASWAGAGIFPPGYPGDPRQPLAQLTAFANQLWPGLNAALLETTGIDNGYRRCGGLEFGPGSDEGLASEIRAWREAGAVVEALEATDLRKIEPAINPEVGGGYRLPDLCQVRNPWHLRALEAACRSSGVEIVSDAAVVIWELDDDRVLSVRTATERHLAGAFILAAGPWSDGLAAELGIPLDIVPVRGQIVLLDAPEIRLSHVIECGPRYIVPRGDGHILIGSTEEDVGFVKETTTEGLEGLLRFGSQLIPQIASARIENSWSGLRPQARRGRPWIGRAPRYDNFHLATGHYRAGLHLSPATARLLAQVLCGEPPSIPIEPFGAPNLTLP